MKLVAPATLRNCEPLSKALRGVLPASGCVLEVGSGSGQHAAHFAREFPGLTVQPTDVSDEALASIRAYADEAKLPNLLEPRFLHAAGDWPEFELDVVLAINVLHITPWSVSDGLFRGAGLSLVPKGAIITYGPYRFSGRFTAESNARFDATLREQDPSWGVRDVDDLKLLADREGFVLDEILEMPANNHLLVFRWE